MKKSLTVKNGSVPTVQFWYSSKTVRSISFRDPLVSIFSSSFISLVFNTESLWRGWLSIKISYPSSSLSFIIISLGGLLGAHQRQNQRRLLEFFLAGQKFLNLEPDILVTMLWVTLKRNLASFSKVPLLISSGCVDNCQMELSPIVIIFNVCICVPSAGEILGVCMQHFLSSNSKKPHV